MTSRPESVALTVPEADRLWYALVDEPGCDDPACPDNAPDVATSERRQEPSCFAALAALAALVLLAVLVLLVLAWVIPLAYLLVTL